MCVLHDSPRLIPINSFRLMRSNDCSPQYLSSYTLDLFSFCRTRQQTLHPQKLYVLIFRPLDRTREDQRLSLNGGKHFRNFICSYLLRECNFVTFDFICLNPYIFSEFLLADFNYAFVLHSGDETWTRISCLA
jgi:hypothetical protein